MHKKRVKRSLAYFAVPVIFTVIGYLLLYVAFKPVWNLAIGTITMFMADSEPVFNTGLTSIYEPGAHKLGDELEEDAEGAENLLYSSDMEFPALYSKYGEISCERIGLMNVGIYWGDTDEVLEYGGGQYTGSLLPGYGQMILIAGHNLTYFAPFQYVEAGDIFKFSTYYADYEYEVTRVEVYNENDLWQYYLDHWDDREELVMYTCYPFHPIVGRKTERLTVFCERISGPDVQWIEGQYD